MMFLGLAIFLLAGATAIYLRLVHIPNPVTIDRAAIPKNFEQLTPTQTFQEWTYLRQGMERTEMPIVLVYWDYLARRQRWSWVAWGVAGVGAAMAIGGALVPQEGASGRPRPGAPRKATG